MKRIVLFMGFVLALLLEPLWAQDAAMTSFFPSPNQWNPALTGEEEQPRVMLSYRNQWPAFGKNFVTYRLAYEQKVFDTQSAWGGEVMRDMVGNGFSSTSLQASYSYNARLSYDMRLRMGLQGGLAQYRINPDRFVFYEDLIGGDSSVDPYLSADASWVPDVSAGMVFFYRDILYAGVALFHINEPAFSFLSGAGDQTGRLGRRLVLHGGLNISLARTTLMAHKRISWIALAMMYQQQEGFKKARMGAELHLRTVYGGLALSRVNGMNSVTPSLALGWTAGLLQMEYAYDLPSQRGISGSGGAHEITIGLQIPRRR